ncbi:hypothetical protein AA12717_2651 [Gluconacetobacter sacchari DSM 12717]|uniref:Uncharacterized protein n=1 Tax=Gluconacetobacter sacchari DSM 12717 TaxID=1307940 RepID=A0ABQ0P9H4_9PROT|nr:hypothetical protein AA12717_2651 [Gluconacetobacter sacchari DSM 12717]
MQAGVGFQVHFAEDLWELQKALGKQKQQHLPALAREGKIGERPFRFLVKRGHCLAAVPSLVPRLRVSHFRAWDGVIGHCVSHKLREPVRIETAIRVDCQAVTVNLYLVSIEDGVALDELKVNFESLRIAGKRGIQILESDIRQVVPSNVATGIRLASML